MVSMVKVMDMKGKFIKFAQLNEELLRQLKESDYITIKK